MVGKTISHYKVLEKIGQGGMGEGYLAEDGRLNRKVALKILPQHLSERAELRERFEREARAVSSTQFCSVEWTSSGPRPNLEGGLVRGGRCLPTEEIFLENRQVS